MTTRLFNDYLETNIRINFFRRTIFFIFFFIFISVKSARARLAHVSAVCRFKISDRISPLSISWAGSVRRRGETREHVVSIVSCVQ